MMHGLDNTPGHSFTPGQSRGLSFLAHRELTARERKVWGLLASGYSDAEIAQRLAVNALTVRFHVSNLLVKLGVDERREAVILARQRGLLAGVTGL
jgi:ATP/maltotriose-dependent transcriptional regulator MalT